MVTEVSLARPTGTPFPPEAPKKKRAKPQDLHIPEEELRNLGRQYKRDMAVFSSATQEDVLRDGATETEDLAAEVSRSSSRVERDIHDNEGSSQSHDSGL